MTDPFIDTIWSQFAVESEEHFETIERLLMAAERGEVTADDIAALFRSFHSIKGMCKAMDLVSMETVAHRAEDLLDLARSKRTSLNADLAGQLLQALDALKGLHEKVVGTRSDTKAPQSLLNILRQTYLTLTSGTTSSSTTIEKTALPSTDIASSTTHPTLSLPSDEATLIQSGDVEMLGYFVEHTAEQMPSLIEKYRTLFSVGSTTGIPELIEGLEYASDVMKLTTLTKILRELRDIATLSSALTPENHSRSHALLRQFQGYLVILEQRTGKNTQSSLLENLLCEKGNSKHLENATPSEPQKTASVPPLLSPPSSPPPAAAKTLHEGGAVIRVPSETLDQFMNQIGDMVLAKSRLNHALNDEQVRDTFVSYQRDWQIKHPDMREGLTRLSETFSEHQTRLLSAEDHLHRALVRLQEGAMALRVVPMETVFKRFPRLVRDLSHAQNKQIRLTFSGEEVRIDKTMVEVLAEPLMHMLRNSVDHGIETAEERLAQRKPAEATISLRARQQGNRVIVQIVDDGRGINSSRVLAKAIERGLVKKEESHTLSVEQIEQLIFLPGFSTAEKITETSGRGVGMDVVRSSINRLGGAVYVQSEEGRGCTITIQLPLSAAIQEVLMVETSNHILALPRRYVEEVIVYSPSDLQPVQGRPALLSRGAFLPIVHMETLLRLPSSTEAAPNEHSFSLEENRTAVVIVSEHYRLGIEVEHVGTYTELFMKDIHRCLMALPGIGGAAILGDGRVVLILDGEDLFYLAGRLESSSLSIFPHSRDVTPHKVCHNKVVSSPRE